MMLRHLRHSAALNTDWALRIPEGIWHDALIPSGASFDILARASQRHAGRRCQTRAAWYYTIASMRTGPFPAIADLNAAPKSRQLSTLTASTPMPLAR